MVCSKCGKTGDEHAFATFRDRKGVQRRRGVCKSCRGQYALDNFERLQKWRREYNAKNRSAKRERDRQVRAEAKSYIDSIKTATPCKDCGRHFPPVAMDFDHIGPKSGDVARMVGSGYRLELIKAEIEKCELVCACCHRVRTAARKQHRAPHRDMSLGM